MYDKGFKELEIISQAVGNSPDMVQGGGGNTSVKLDSELMAVKASGYRLNQIVGKEGFVVVNYRNIRDYCINVDPSSGIDYEKDSTEFVKKNIVRLEGLKELRPSVEAGFHSVLKKYVIHTHPVYANILCCCTTGEEMVEKIFKDKEYAAVWTRYINPGFSLSLEIMNAADRCVVERGIFPEVIFMENHGLIVTCDDYERCIRLHSQVNEEIKKFLGICEPYPPISLEKLDENTFESKTGYLIDFFKGSTVTEEFFEEKSLYPDQLAYLNGSISINSGGGALQIDTGSGRLIYRTGYQNALTMEETLLGYIYVLHKVEECGLTLKKLPQEGIDFIKGWESEKYRKKMIEKH